ncbi:MAG: hypothetical protein HFJ65_04725 [Eggerthellaceae bacterium]|nr:hypothetical protein [Eggerthellaceae bacterium]
MKSKRSTELGEEVLLAIFAVMAVVAIWAYSGVAGHIALEQGAVTLRQTVLDAAMQCMAIEGAYPDSLEHLEKEYGVVVNRDDYVVSYEAFAANMLPTVQVIPR